MACGLEIVGLTNSTISNNDVHDNGQEGGVCLVDNASSGNTIGPGNSIWNNNGPGIGSENGSSVQNRITANQIYGNTGLGIDLGLDGLTANDAGDGDTGANDLMNFPVIYSAEISGGTITITGEARPGATVEFFEADGDPSIHGEGQVFVASAVENSGDDSNGSAGTVDPTAAQFTFSLPAGSLAVGDELTATATDASGNTSEFAANVSVTSP